VVRDRSPILLTCLGVALAQGWLPVVAAIVSGYDAGGASLVGFLTWPFWFGYALGMLAALSVIALRRSHVVKSAPSEVISLCLSLFGFMLVILSYTLAHVAGIGDWLTPSLAFVGMALSAWGSFELSCRWLGWAVAVADISNGTGAKSDAGQIALGFLAGAALLSFEVCAASLLGHCAWTALLNALLVTLSYLLADRVCRTVVEPPESARKFSGYIRRCAVAGMLVGVALSIMFGQFLGAEFGSLIKGTWALLLAGVALAAAVQGIVRVACHEWLPQVACWASAIAVILAFYPFEFGTDFSLKFSSAFAVVAAGMCASLLPAAAGMSAEKAKANSLVASAAILTGMFAGVAVCGPAGYLIADFPWGNIIKVLAVCSMVMAIASIVLVVAVPAAPSCGVASGEQDIAGMIDGVSTKDSSQATLEACLVLSSKYGLTPRESDVLMVLSRGYDVSRVQQELGISEGTALTHKRHIYQKLGIHSRSELLDTVEKMTQGDMQDKVHE
jgi:DNA-binding CsgD family transcriptional regulator